MPIQDLDPGMNLGTFRTELAPSKDLGGNDLLNVRVYLEKLRFKDGVELIAEQRVRQLEKRVASGEKIPQELLADTKFVINEALEGRPDATADDEALKAALNSRLDAIDSAGATSKEIVSGGRNTFEKWLIEQGFPKHRIIPDIPPGASQADKEKILAENWRIKRSFYLTYWLRYVLSVDGNFITRTIRPITGKNITIGKDSLTVFQIAESAGAEIEGIEGDVARRMAERLGWDLGLFDVIIDFYNGYFEAYQSIDGLKKKFSIQTEGGKQLTFVNWAFDILDELPPLVYNLDTLEADKDIKLETTSFSKQLLKACREIIARGRRTTKVAVGTPQERTVLDKSSVNYIFPIVSPRPGESFDEALAHAPEKEVFKHPWIILRDSNGRASQYKRLRGNPAAGGGTDPDKGIWPVVSFYNAAKTNENFEEVAHNFSSPGLDRKSSYQELSPERKRRASDYVGQITAMIADHLLAGFNFEDAVQDNWRSTKSPQGRPVGVNYASRLLHPGEYMNKVIEDPSSRLGPVNKWMIGTTRQMIGGLFDTINYRGSSLTERILDERTEGWMDKPPKDKDPGQRGVIDPGVLPPEFNRNWMTAIYRSADVFETMMNGLKAGKIQSIAEFKLAEGKIVINQAMVEALVSFYRLVTEYRTYTEAGPSLAINKDELLAIGEEPGDHLDGSFALIEVRDANGVVLGNPKEPMYTRFFAHYEATPQELAMWAQHPTDENKLSPDLIDQGKTRWDVLAPNKYGIRRNRLTIQLKYVSPEPLKDKSDPKKLLARYLVSHMLYIITRQNIESHTLEKEDYMGILMLFSASYKHSYEMGGERGPWIKFVHWLGEVTKIESLKTETPEILGPDVFTPKQAYMLLELMGVEIKLEEVIKQFNDSADELTRFFKA